MNRIWDLVLKFFAYAIVFLFLITITFGLIVLIAGLFDIIGGVA